MAALRCARENARDRLGEAERPHAFVTSVSDRVREFSQPFYREVAKERLPRLISEETALAALRKTIVELAGSSGAFATIDPEERDVALAVGCDLLATKDTSEEHRRLAARLFLRRMRLARARLEKDTAGELAFQLAIAAMEKRVERDAVKWAEWFEVVETLNDTGRYHWSAAVAFDSVDAIDELPPTLESRIVRCQMQFIVGWAEDSGDLRTGLKPEEVWDEVEAQVRELIAECDDPRPRVTLIQCLRMNSQEQPHGRFNKEEIRARTYEAFAVAEALLANDRTAENLRYSALVLMDLASWAETEDERAQAGKIALELAREREGLVGPHWGRILIRGAVLALAQAQRAQGNLPQAIERFREVISLSKQTLEESDALKDMLTLNWDRQRLARTYLEAGDIDAALDQVARTEALLDEMDRTVAAQSALAPMTSFNPTWINRSRSMLGHIRRDIEKARAGEKLD
jgi:tetratricopeptide (TPR) repeat protein